MLPELRGLGRHQTPKNVGWTAAPATAASSIVTAFPATAVDAAAIAAAVAAIDAAVAAIDAALAGTVTAFVRCYQMSCG